MVLILLMILIFGHSTSEEGESRSSGCRTKGVNHESGSCIPSSSQMTFVPC